MAKLTINTTAIENGFRVALSGDADTLQIDALELEIDRLIRSTPKQVAIDLSGLTFISSAGMGAFMKLWSALKKTGGDLRVGGAKPEIAESFRRARLDRMLIFVQSV